MLWREGNAGFVSAPEDALRIHAWDPDVTGKVTAAARLSLASPLARCDRRDVDPHATAIFSFSRTAEGCLHCPKARSARSA